MAGLMIVGFGDLGGILTELLLRTPGMPDITIATRNIERAQRRCNLARFGAVAQGLPPKIRLMQLDLDSLDATAATIHKEQPDIILTTATMATWWLPDLLPKEDAIAIRQAGFGVWLPAHLRPTLRLMQAAKAAQFKGKIVTAPYPDVVNFVLGKVDLAPTCGIGNVAEMVPKLRIRAAEQMQVPIDRIRVSMVAHHALGRFIYSDRAPRDGEAVPPFHVRVTLDGEDVTHRLDLRNLVTSPAPITPGRASHWLTASSAVPLMQALLSDVPEFQHVPAPMGLPGGYPVRASRAGIDLALQGISLDAAKAINLDAQKFDGIERLLDDGTVLFKQENVARLKHLLGECPDKLALADLDEQARDLVERFQTYALSKGARLL